MKTLNNGLIKKAKKGFTLTELAIVIAVIAILIAVLVPTFTSIITKANQTSAISNAKNTVTEYFTEYYCNPEDGTIIDDGSDYYVTYDTTTDDVYTATKKGDTYATTSYYHIYDGELADIYCSTLTSGTVESYAYTIVNDYNADSTNTTKLSSGYVSVTYNSTTYWFTYTTSSISSVSTAPDVSSGYQSTAVVTSTVTFHTAS